MSMEVGTNYPKAPDEQLRIRLGELIHEYGYEAVYNQLIGATLYRTNCGELYAVFSSRTANLFCRGGIDSLAHLADIFRTNPKSLYNLKGFGKASYQEVEAYLTAQRVR